MYPYWSGLLLGTISLISRSSAAVRSCTPENQRPETISCEYSTKTSHCPDLTHKDSATPLQPVEDITIQRYFNNVVNYTGVKISWSAPTAAALNATAGYALSLYTTNSNNSKELVLCRHFQITSKREIARQIEASYKFVYLEPVISYYSTRIDVELVTIPSQPILYAPADSMSAFTTYGNPVDKFFLNGSVAASSQPYTVTVRFRLSSYSEDTRVLYNVTEYVVLLSDYGNGIIQHINGSMVTLIKVYPDDVTEYAEVTFDSLIPGRYTIQVWPYIKEKQCPILCDPTLDMHQIGSFIVSVFGYDYVPDLPPTLNISDPNKVVITFQVAPTYLYIVRYEVILRQSHGDTTLKEQEVIPNEADDWYTHEYVFSIVKVMETFNIITDTVFAEIVPVSDSRLCDRPGLCNLNGTCTNCTKSFSAPEKLPASSPDSLTLIVLLVIGSLFLVIASLVAVVFLRRWRRKPNNPECSGPRSDNRSLTTGITGGDGVSEMLFGPASPQSLVAFAASDQSKKQYKELYNILSNIFQKFFNCTLSSHLEICRRNSFEVQKYNAAIIICTPELFEFHQRVMECPELDALPQDQLYYSKVRNLLLPLHSPDSPTRILVTFDHIQHSHVKALSRDLQNDFTVFSLPTQLKELVLAMYEADKSADVSSWDCFCRKGQSLKEQLTNKIQAVAAAYQDSGYDTATVTTAEQIRRMDQPATTELRKNTQPEAKNPRVEQLRQSLITTKMPPTNRGGAAWEGERFSTIQPRAEEMRYFHSNPSTVRPRLQQPDPQLTQPAMSDRSSVVTVPESIYTMETVDSVLTVDTEHQNLALSNEQPAIRSASGCVPSAGSEETNPLVLCSIPEHSEGSEASVSTCRITRSDGTEVHRVIA